MKRRKSEEGEEGRREERRGKRVESGSLKRDDL